MLPAGRFIGLKMWWAYTFTSIRYHPISHARAMLWRDFYNWLLPLKLRGRVWNWCFESNFRDWESKPWWSWK